MYITKFLTELFLVVFKLRGTQLASPLKERLGVQWKEEMIGNELTDL